MSIHKECRTEIEEIIKSLNLNNKYVLSFGFANYLHGRGGVDKVIAEHQELLNYNNISYIFISKYQKVIGSYSLFSNLFSVVIDGKFICFADEIKIYRILCLLSDKKYALVGAFIHHFMDVDLQFMQKLLNCAECPIFFYVHDFYSVCIQYNLLRNDEEYCGDDECSEKKCSYCKYFQTNLLYKKNFDYFFEKYYDRLQIIAPSKCAGEIWIKSHPEFVNKLSIISHQKIVLSESIHRKNEISKPIKVAFIGSKVKVKGWKECKNLFDSIKNDKRYELIYCGSYDVEEKYIKKIDVHVKSGNLGAMTDSLQQEKVDCVILWSIWPETYAYTYFEAWASDCYIITNENSGNIVYSVKQNKNGIVLKNENDLKEIFLNGKIFDLINTYRANNIKCPERLLINNEILALLDSIGYAIKLNEQKFNNNCISCKIANSLYRIKEHYRGK